MIKRRQVTVGLGSMAASGVPTSFLNAQQKLRKNSLMHVGGDYHSVAGGDIISKQNLEYNLRHGVKHLTAEVKKRSHGGWDADELKRMKDSCDKFGLVFEAIRMDSDYIKLRKGDDRDREIETIVGNIRKASQVGVRIITYNWQVIPYRRNGKTAGRGGTVHFFHP